MKFAPAIAFDYRPSRWIGAAASLVAACAAIAPWLAELPLAVRVLVSLGALAAGVAALWRYAFARFRRIAWRESGWLLVDLGGNEHPAMLDRHARLGAWLSLAFRYGPRARFQVIIGPDNLDADARRRLILLLRRVDADAGIDP